MCPVAAALSRLGYESRRYSVKRMPHEYICSWITVEIEPDTTNNLKTLGNLAQRWLTASLLSPNF